MTDVEDPFEVDIDICPPDTSSGWSQIDLENLDELREELQIPVVTENNIEAYDDLGIGTFARVRGSDYVAGLR